VPTSTIPLGGEMGKGGEGMGAEVR